jgi:hypothetical protein
MHKFSIYFICLFTSALHVSGFLLAHLQGQVYKLDSGSSLLGMVSGPGGDTIPKRLELLPNLYTCLRKSAKRKPETCKAEVNR